MSTLTEILHRIAHPADTEVHELIDTLEADEGKKDGKNA